MELQNIIDKAVASGFDSVEVIVNSSKEATIDLFNGEVEKNFIGEVSKYTVKAIYAEATPETITDATIAEKFKDSYEVTETNYPKKINLR